MVAAQDSASRTLPSIDPLWKVGRLIDCMVGVTFVLGLQIDANYKKEIKVFRMELRSVVIVNFRLALVVVRHKAVSRHTLSETTFGQFLIKV